jgi:tryptophan halogenase
LCLSKGINFYDDEIKDFDFNSNGEIELVRGDVRTYTYDFYIDATGFKKILMNKLGAKWKSYKPYLKMKSAITFQSPDEENYNLWTLAKAMKAGWLFKIPVWGRHGNGYIFDSDYISADEAKIEVETLLQREIDIGKQFNFDPGCLEKVWIKNCCAVGLSASFVEPLEASSIGTTIQQSFILMHKIINYNDAVINQYNNFFNEIMNNIRDFIALHYVTKKDETPFWKDLKNLELPDSLKNNLELWKNKLPIKEDFNSISNYTLFNNSNYILVMHGLNLFNREKIKNEYELIRDKVKIQADVIMERQQLLNNNTENLLTHKKFLSLIRDNF